MSGGFGDDDDLDMFGGDDDEADDDEAEEESELGGPAPDHSRPLPTAQAIARARQGKRRVRLRPMTPKMRAKHPDAVSIAITRNDGRQLIFVR